MSISTNLTDNPPRGSVSFKPTDISPRGRSMNGASPMSRQTTFADLGGSISSPGSADGNSPCNLPDGPMIGPYGPALVHASHSARLASGKAKPTNGTSGPKCSGSSASAALQRSLENRCRQLFGSVGSMEYSQTWKAKATPAGRSYLEHTALGRRTSDSVCTGWPTPDKSAGDGGRMSANPGQAKRQSGTKQQFTINDAAALAGWPTPDTNQRGGPQSPEKRKAGGHSVTLQDVASISGWATTTARDHKDGSSVENVPENGLLGRQVHGATTTSSHAETGKRGALNPAFCRWLMGFPAEWDSSGGTAMQSCRKSPQRLSKRSSKRKKKNHVEN